MPKCLTTPVTEYTHTGTYNNLTCCVTGVTQGREYSLIYESLSGSVAFINDNDEWFWLNGSEFTVTAHLDDRPVANDPAWDDDDDEGLAGTLTFDDDDDSAWSDESCSDDGEMEALVVDLNPDIPFKTEEVPEGPKSTDELRKHRYTPDLF